MTKQDEFENSIINNDFSKVKILLENKDVDPTNVNFAMKHSSGEGYLKILILLLKDSRINPALENNCCIIGAAVSGHFDVIQLLMQNKKVNPADQNNYCLRLALIHKHTDIVKLLLKNHMVQSNLDKIPKYENELYNKFIHKEIKEKIQKKAKEF